MPNKPKLGTVPLNVFVPEEIKRAMELQTITNKYPPNSGPTTLTNLVIAALQAYLEDHDDIRAFDAAKARLASGDDTLIPLDRVLADLAPAPA